MSGNCNQSFSQSQKWCNVLGLSKRTLQACSNLNGVKSNAKVLRCATTALATRWKHISCSSHFEGPQICSKGLQKCAATVVRAAACSFLLLAMWTSFNEASHGKHDALWVLMVIPSWEASSQKKMYACSALAILCRIYIYIHVYIYIYLFIYLFIYLPMYTIYYMHIYIYIYIISFVPTAVAGTRKFQVMWAQGSVTRQTVCLCASEVRGSELYEANELAFCAFLLGYIRVASPPPHYMELVRFPRQW